LVIFFKVISIIRQSKYTLYFNESKLGYTNPDVSKLFAKLEFISCGKC